MRWLVVRAIRGTGIPSGGPGPLFMPQTKSSGRTFNARARASRVARRARRSETSSMAMLARPTPERMANSSCVSPRRSRRSLSRGNAFKVEQTPPEIFPIL
jgi:hypothetical protein